MKSATLALMLVPTLVACGPLPGYYPEAPVPGASAPPPRPPTPAPPGATAPAPGAPAGTPSPATSQAPAPARSGVIVVKTGDPEMRYLIDTQRRLCFFQTRAALATVPCSSIPEAAAALGAQGGGGAASSPQSSRGPAPTTPARLGPATTPDPTPRPRAEPSEAPQPAGATDPRSAPTAAEREHFERAYVAIFCDRRAGDTTEPAQRILAEGLSVERYTAIESWSARDERVWRDLTRKAVLGCSGQ